MNNWFLNDHAGAATDPTKSLPVSMPSYSESGEGIKAKQKASSKLNISTPTGYNVLVSKFFLSYYSRLQ